MLQPKRTKYRKVHKGRNDGLSWSANAVSFGEYGLKATAHGQLTARQIEAARRSISRYVKRGGKMWIRVFPDKPITKKPIEVRMGSGKGNVEYWVAQIQPGRMIYEIEGVPRKWLARRSAWPPPSSRSPPLRDPYGALMDIKTLREKSADELKAHLIDLRKEQFSVRMQQVTGQLPKTHDIRRVRREIARVKTLLGSTK